jgi:hypothetical protein
MTSTQRPDRRGHRRVLGLLLPVCLLFAGATGALAASHSKHATPGSYSGVTSKPGGVPVTFTVSANGKKVLSFSTQLGYDGKCGQGGGPGYEVKVKSMAITANGAFSATVKGTFPVAAAKVKPVKVKVSGHISGGAASGVVFVPGDKCSNNSHENPFSETFTAKHT